MAYCKNFRNVLRTHDYEDYVLTVIRGRCKMWSCATCAKINARMWRYALTKQFVEIKPLPNFCFFTLTVHLRDFHELNNRARAEKSAKVIRENSDKLWKRLRRLFGSFTYVRVIESHKSGLLHIHVVASFHFTDVKLTYRGSVSGKKKWVKTSKILKDISTECGFGYIVHAENLASNGENWNALQVIGYVTKYITKDSEYVENVQKGLRVRKIVTSRDLLSPFNAKFKIKESDMKWTLGLPVSIEFAEFVNFNIYDLDRKKRISKEDYGDNIYYPTKEDTDLT